MARPLPRTLAGAAGLLSSIAGLAAAQAGTVPLATFDGTPGTTFDFKELNDPVMGGLSTGTWHVDAASGVGVLDGEVVDVPSLKAPGFIKASADGRFPDASSAIGGELVLLCRSSTPDYTGFRVSIASGTMSPSYACAGGGSIPFSRGCYKAHFTVGDYGEKFIEINIPFRLFSDKWSPATGEQTASCADDPDVCMTEKTLANIRRIEVWAEGVAGKVHLELKGIFASGPEGTTSLLEVAGASRPPAEYDSCSGPVQGGLRYGISGRTTPDVPVPVEASESLAEAVCCDRRTKVFAEPQFLYQAPDIDFYGKLQEGVTTFHDSVCGLPLFRAPINRSLDDFKADTDEHGWPSFRVEEVVRENVHEDSDGFVYSKCGTHLGSYLPDEKGPRWCMDLSCIAGNPSGQAAKSLFM